MIDLTSEIEPPSFSQRGVIELIELILWANIALANSLPSSLLDSLVFIIVAYLH